MGLGDNIRFLRNKRGFSQEYIAEKLGYKSFTTIQKWESGVSEPPIKKLRELSELLNVDMDDMINKDIQFFETKNELSSKNDFKDMLKYLRSRDHLSQAELAAKLGVSKSTISMYEVGRREPDFETLETIADFFNVDMNFLLGKNTSENDNDANFQAGQFDIKKHIDIIMESLDGKDKIVFEGQEVNLTEQSKRMLRYAMEIAYEAAKNNK